MARPASWAAAGHRPGSRTTHQGTRRGASSQHRRHCGLQRTCLPHYAALRNFFRPHWGPLWPQTAMTRPAPWAAAGRWPPAALAHDTPGDSPRVVAAAPQALRAAARPFTSPSENVVQSNFE